MTIEILSTTETLVGTTKGSKKKFWQKQILSIDGAIHTRSVFWQDNSVVTEAAPTLIERKNVGRANETSELEQATLEVEAEIKRQLDKGYTFLSDTTASVKLPLPMLAHEYFKHQSKLTDVVACQPKFDGTRCLSDGKQFWSRKGKPYIPEIAERFSFDCEGVILDGELILPEPYTFQETVSAVKKSGVLTRQLQYRVYDLIDESLHFPERFAKLKSLPLNPNITVVETKFISQEGIAGLHKEYVADGYEGTMVRSLAGFYEVNKRSYSLLKLKDFFTDEYRIVDVIDGKGKEMGLAIFTCETPEGLTFNCRPEGKEEYRAELFKNRQELIGQFLSIRYQNLTDDKNIPRFPIGLTVRNYE